jgi:hypothetical protein
MPGKCKLTEVCQSRQPLSLKRLYRRLRLSYRYNGRMRQALKVHPDSLCSAVTHIEVEIMHPRAGRLVLFYLVTGSIGDVRIPAAVLTQPTLPYGHEMVLGARLGERQSGR